MLGEDKEAIVLMLLAVFILITWPLTAVWVMPIERILEKNLLAFFGTLGLMVYWGWRKRTAYNRKWKSE